MSRPLPNSFGTEQIKIGVEIYESYNGSSTEFQFITMKFMVQRALLLVVSCLVGLAQSDALTQVQNKLFKTSFGVSGAIWKKYIYKSSKYKSSTAVECLAMCRAEGTACVISSRASDGSCHMGHPDNTNNALAADQDANNILFDWGTDFGS